MKPTEKLRAWIAAERENGLVDLNVFPGTSDCASIEDVAQAVLETVTGARLATPLDTSDL